MTIMKVNQYIIRVVYLEKSWTCWNPCLYELFFVAEEDTLEMLLRKAENPFNSKAETSEENESASANQTLHAVSAIPAASDRTDTQSTFTQGYSREFEIFPGLKFVIQLFTLEQQEEIKATIEELGGQVVSRTYRWVYKFNYVWLGGVGNGYLIHPIWLWGATQSNKT